MQSRASLGNWSIVVVCFLVLSVSFAARAVLGLSMPYLERDLSWSRSFISSGGAPALGVLAGVGPLPGKLVNRLGPRFLLFARLGAGGAGLGVFPARAELGLIPPG